MGSFVNFLVVLTLAVAASHASLLPEEYWKTVLPGTPMPKAVINLLQPDYMQQENTAVDVGKGGVHVDAGHGKPGGTTVNVGKGHVDVNAGKGKPGGGTHVNVGKGTGVNVNTGKPGGGTNVNVGRKGVGVNTGHPGGNTNVGVGKGGVRVDTGNHGGNTNVGVGKGGVGVHTGHPGGGTNVGVGKGGVSVGTGHKGRHVYVGVSPKNKASPFVYRYAATQTQLHDDPNVALFFTEKDMLPGSQMNLHFIQDSNRATFLPRQEATSIPFSSNKLPEILSEFLVQPESTEAETINNTIKECEAPGIKGEDKYCATSLESMIDYSTSKLGKNLNAISTEVEKETKMQKYKISAQPKEMARDKAVVCHKQNWPFALFYCHATSTTKVYAIPLEGVDGTKAKAVAVCHTNTAAWNPKHLAFQVLKVKPGTIPVCHFLPEDHIVWIPK